MMTATGEASLAKERVIVDTNNNALSLEMRVLASDCDALGRSLGAPPRKIRMLAAGLKRADSRMRGNGPAEQRCRLTYRGDDVTGGDAAQVTRKESLRVAQRISRAGSRPRKC